MNKFNKVKDSTRFVFLKSEKYTESLKHVNSPGRILSQRRLSMAQLSVPLRKLFSKSDFLDMPSVRIKQTPKANEISPDPIEGDIK